MKENNCLKIIQQLLYMLQNSTLHNCKSRNISVIFIISISKRISRKKKINKYPQKKKGEAFDSASTGLPAPPGKPILIPGADESQPDVVAIRWERSPSNGGSAIVGYLVEHRRLGSQHWVRSTPGLCTFPELTLSGLEPGWRYQFRVRAQNAVGLSRPSEISDPLTVTLQRSVASAPQFDLEVKDTTILENEQVISPLFPPFFAFLRNSVDRSLFIIRYFSSIS